MAGEASADKPDGNLSSKYRRYLEFLAEPRAFLKGVELFSMSLPGLCSRGRPYIHAKDLPLSHLRRRAAISIQVVFKLQFSGCALGAHIPNLAKNWP
jgi:hypothetical protein